MRTSRSAFTILELSVVLVIIGLIIGGIMGGRAMLRSSQVNKVATDVAAYRGASDQFYQQYEWLPGDIPTAVQIWGRADAGTDLTVNCTTVNVVGAGTATCNGNGDGQITESASFPELHRAWQHMANAGYLTGSYSGVSGAGHAVSHVVPGVNAPLGPWRRTGYTYTNFGLITGNGNVNYFDGDYREVFMFGGTSDTYTNNNVLTGREAFDIDTKYDDGLPARGNIVTYKGTGVNNMSRACASTNVQSTAIYQRNSNDPRCVLMFLRDFKGSKA